MASLRFRGKGKWQNQTMTYCHYKRIEFALFPNMVGTAPLRGCLFARFTPLEDSP